MQRRSPEGRRLRTEHEHDHIGLTINLVVDANDSRTEDDRARRARNARRGRSPPTTGAAVVDPDPCSSPDAQWVPENALVGLGYLDARITFDPPVAVQGQKVQFRLTISNRHRVAVTNADDNGYYDHWMLSYMRRKDWSGDASLAPFLLPCPQELVFPAHTSVTYRGEIDTVGMKAGTRYIYIYRRDDSWRFVEQIDGRSRPAGTFILQAAPTTTTTTTTG